MVKPLNFKYKSIHVNPVADKQLAEEGYITFPFLDEDEIEKLKKYYFEFQRENPTHFYASTHSPDFSFRRKTSDFIKEVILAKVPKHLKDYDLLGAAFVVKPGKGNGILQAHQDWNLVDEEKARSYNIWIPLIDVNESNGAVFVLPQSHTKLITYRGPGIDSPFKNIEQEIWHTLKPLPMKAGEALIYDHALIHGSPTNQTPEDRIGIVIGVVNKGEDLQIVGRDKEILKSFRCDENFFLSKNISTDYKELPLLTSISEPQKELTFKEFSEVFTPSNTDKSVASMQKTNTTDNRTFFEKYTLKNIVAETNYRLFGKTISSPLIDKQVNEIPFNKDVAKFYNEQTDNFLKVYGNVIQAFRTKDVSTILQYQMETMGLNESMTVLDAGCGVCGPAIYFAKNSGVKIEAITISEVQQQKAQRDIEANGLKNKIKVIEGDFHVLDKYYPQNHFNVIYFLESFGHATNHAEVLDSAWKVLKPGGMIYLKDLFRKKTNNPSIQIGIEKEIQNINKAYHYNVPELNLILDHVRSKGYILSSLKTIDIPLQEFENLSISNDFQELTGINKIENLREYIFPVDFFELKIIKPSFDLNAGNSRYFLQNMYFMQIENWKESDL